MELRDRIFLLLDDTLGAFPVQVNRRWRAKSPILGALRNGVTYAIPFCGLSWIMFRDSGPLFGMSVWGSFYLAFAAAIARSTSRSTFGIVENGILPDLSETAAAAIGKDLARRFSTKRVWVVSLFAAMVAAGVSGIALYYDVKKPTVSPLEIGWSCCGYFFLYLTAARTTYIARFYGTFAAHLRIDSDRLYALDPAHSRQVARIASVGQRVLLFWFGIVCSVATLYPIFSHPLPRFVIFVVPTASFFSMGFGTIVFLNSERNIRSVVREVASSTLRSLEQEISALFSRRSTLDESQWDRMQGLVALRDKVVATGSYHSALLSWLGVLVPLVLPLVPPVVEVWKYLAK